MGGNRGWVEGSTCKGGKGRHELYSASVYVIQTVGIVEHV